jgi:hypothetical protein
VSHTRGMDVLSQLSKLKDGLKTMGWERERGALAMLAVSFFGLFYVLFGLNAPDGWGRVFLSLGLCYLIAFIGLASQWFWARWFASGLGWSGFMVGLMSLVMVGWHPALAVYTGFHFLILAALWGSKMAARYELQTEWRARYGMDEFGVARLGKAVTRGSASLPTLIMWALAPREGQGLFAQLLPTLLFLLGALGVAAVLRLRTWGLLAIGAAAGLALAVTLLLPSMASLDFTTTANSLSTRSAELPLSDLWTVLGSPLVAVGWGALALAVFAGPIARFLRRS